MSLISSIFPLKCQESTSVVRPCQVILPNFIKFSKTTVWMIQIRVFIHCSLIGRRHGEPCHYSQLSVCWSCFLKHGDCKDQSAVWEQSDERVPSPSLSHRARNAECDRAAATTDASQALTGNSPPPPAAPPPFSPPVSPADETSLLDSEFTWKTSFLFNVTNLSHGRSQARPDRSEVVSTAHAAFL